MQATNYDLPPPYESLNRTMQDYPPTYNEAVQKITITIPGGRRNTDIGVLQSYVCQINDVPEIDV
ncbi:hypothetical protein COBT_001822, partial [Conglomerata obtusa]